MKLKTILSALVAGFALVAVAVSPSQAGDYGSYGKKDKKDIVDTAAAAGSFNTLIAAVQAAGLEDTLRADGPYTVFAPTDAAFEKLGQDTINELLKPENREQLRAVLLYHVLTSKVKSKAIAGKTLTVETAQGGMLNVDGTNGVMINNATVTQADVKASNGIIHVIDTVLIPGQ